MKARGIETDMHELEREESQPPRKATAIRAEELGVEGVPLDLLPPPRAGHAARAAPSITPRRNKPPRREQVRFENASPGSGEISIPGSGSQAGLWPGSREDGRVGGLGKWWKPGSMEAPAQPVPARSRN